MTRRSKLKEDRKMRDNTQGRFEELNIEYNEKVEGDYDTSDIIGLSEKAMGYMNSGIYNEANECIDEAFRLLRKLPKKKKKTHKV